MSHATKRVSIISISDRMQISAPKPKARFGRRHLQILLMALGFFCCYAIRVTTSVTLEAMTNAAIANPDFIEFSWDDSTKDVIQSSFFWGYVCTQIIGSIVAQRWGAHKLFSLAQFMCGFVTLLIPLLAQYCGWEAVCVTRVIAGLFQGTVLPCIHTLLSKWVPIEERGTMSTFVYAGGWIGNVICLLSTGLLPASSLGWPSCFYIWGAITVTSSMLFFTVGKESPAEHPHIAQDEKEYIEGSLGIIETDQKLSTPWAKILTSGPMWALMATQSAHTWGFWLLLTKIPSYFTSVFHSKIQKNGMMSALPYLVAWLFSFPISYVSDFLIKRKVLTVQASRKICNTIGEWVPAIALLGFGYISKEQDTVAEAILIIAVASNIAIYCGHNVNHMDLSPNFAGPLMGITNTVANICSILAPLVASVMVKDPSDVTEWRSIFFLTSGIYFVGNLIFIIFGTCKIQTWNDPVTEKQDITMNSVNVSTVENGYTQKPKYTKKIDLEKEL
ncbi:PREDICTED: putative inorganic phosphate cotransporter [Eufriesea mexicana]|uniref:putative inorganic phosphate cotransporter n=1 Tax=Eufriesea mexicana TaxID=516756 RepID=UPI00083C85A3|nr:PREDICTED: putative inorganic phosphate cotransporter [Eufriesea mexicana]